MEAIEGIKKFRNNFLKISLEFFGSSFKKKKLRKFIFPLSLLLLPSL